MPETRLVTDAERATFDQDGVVCLRGLIEPAWIAALRQAVQAVMETPTEFSRDLAREGGTGGSFFQEINISRRSAEARRFVQDSPIARAAAEIMGSRTARFFSDQLLV